MKIRIENDVFDVVKRIKQIDDGYFVVFDLDKEKYELHNKYQNNSYCLTYPYSNLDNRLVDIIHYSSVNNIDNIMAEIDNNNRYIECNASNDVKTQSEYMLREIYEFSSNSSKEFEVDSFSTIWIS